MLLQQAAQAAVFPRKFGRIACILEEIRQCHAFFNFTPAAAEWFDIGEIGHVVSPPFAQNSNPLVNVIYFPSHLPTIVRMELLTVVISSTPSSGCTLISSNSSG